MDRRKFLKYFSISAAAIVVAPKVIGEVVKPSRPGIGREPFKLELKEDWYVSKARIKGFTDHTANNVLYTGEEGRKAFEQAINEIFANRI